MGRLKTLEYPTGLLAKYEYAQGRVARLRAVSPGWSEIDIASGITHRPSGAIEGWTYGNGIERRQGYDLDGRLNAISSVYGSTIHQSLTYGHNARDLISAITNGVDAAQSQQFQYDALSRLTRQTYSGDSTVWTAADSVDTSLS